MTEAERLRIIHHLITSPWSEGGAGVTPKEGQWKNVESIFPLHDHTFNKEWIKKWSTMTFLKIEDLDQIRNRFGEKVISRSPGEFTKVADPQFRLPFTLPLHNPTFNFSFSLPPLVLLLGSSSALSPQCLR